MKSDKCKHAKYRYRQILHEPILGTNIYYFSSEWISLTFLSIPATDICNTHTNERNNTKASCYKKSKRSCFTFNLSCSSKKVALKNQSELTLQQKTVKMTKIAFRLGKHSYAVRWWKTMVHANNRPNSQRNKMLDTFEKLRKFLHRLLPSICHIEDLLIKVLWTHAPTNKYRLSAKTLPQLWPSIQFTRS